MAESDYANALYRWLLVGPVPDRIAVLGADMIAGEPTQGSALLNGEFALAGRVVEVGANMPWSVRPPRDPWHTELHGFAWLRHLKALGEARAHVRARLMVGSWIETYGEWDAPSWRPQITGRRLAAWLANGDILLKDAEPPFARRFFASLLRQARFLSRAALKGDDGAARLSALKGLIYSGVCLPEGEGRARRGLKLLEAELTRQIAVDGGHCERSPSLQLAVLREIVELRHSLIDAREEPPIFLQVAIDRMAPMLRTFRHGDGALALFNDGVEESAALVDLVLEAADAHGRAFASASHTGFHTLRAGRTFAIVDTGTPPAIGRRAHASTLGFELSVGRDRIVVNCGSYHGPDAPWRRAVHATAAHSTLCLEDLDSSEVLEDGTLGRRRAQVSATRREHEGNTWLDASHDGYLAPFGLIHRRRLYLAGSGTDLRGEDSLIHRAGAKKAARRFVLRFHLHPGVQASLAQDGSVVWLKVANGPGWQMRAQGGTLALAESVYLGQPGQRRRTEQIIVAGEIGAPDPVVKWAFRRVEPA
jgi:uncharacterized heparinase superfamily protein